MQSIDHLIKQYRLLTDWFLSVLDGVDDDDGDETLSDNTNSLEWLAGHLITGRYRNISRLGVHVEPYSALDKFVDQTIPPPNAIAFDKTIVYQSLTECKQEWKHYSKILLDRLAEIDDTILKTEIPFTVPTGGNTIEDALTFLVMHETFHIGQMSIIRKTIGYPRNAAIAEEVDIVAVRKETTQNL